MLASFCPLCGVKPQKNSLFLLSKRGGEDLYWQQIQGQIEQDIQTWLEDHFLPLWADLDSGQQSCYCDCKDNDAAASDSCWQASIKLCLRLLAHLDLARLVRSLATWALNLHALAKAEQPLAEPLEIALILLANGFYQIKILCSPLKMMSAAELCSSTEWLTQRQKYTHTKTHSHTHSDTVVPLSSMCWALCSITSEGLKQQYNFVSFCSQSTPSSYRISTGGI